MFEKNTIIALPINLPKVISTSTFIGLSAISFSLPFALGHPQWLVGTIVNACLLLSAIFLPKKFVVPLAVLPSLGILSRGIIFGSLSIFLIYFLPFIWLSNLTLIFAFRKLTPRFGYSFSIFLASLVKFLFLFLVANIYFKLSIVPQIFIQLMGLNQFFTAIAGGLISLVILTAYSKRKAKN